MEPFINKARITCFHKGGGRMIFNQVHFEHILGQINIDCMVIGSIGASFYTQYDS